MRDARHVLSLGVCIGSETKTCMAIFFFYSTLFNSYSNYSIFILLKFCEKIRNNLKK